MILLDNSRVDKFFSANYKKLQTICRNITKQDNNDELLHFCIDQVMKNKNFFSIEKDEEKLYFFSRVIKNNFSSKKSPYHRVYRKYQFDELNTEIDKPEESIESDDIDMDWVKEQLMIMKKGKDWYYGRLFDLYIEENCSLTKLSKRTTIPINSVSRDIRKVKNELIKLRNKKLYGL